MWLAIRNAALLRRNLCKAACVNGRIEHTGGEGCSLGCDLSGYFADRGGLGLTNVSSSRNACR